MQKSTLKQWLLPLMLVLAVGIYWLLQLMPVDQASQPLSTQPPLPESIMPIDKEATAAVTAIDAVAPDAIPTDSVATDSATTISVSSTEASARVRALEPEIQQALQQMTDTRSEGLVEEAAVSGYSVNLQGRFQSVPVATVNEQGEIEIEEYSVPKPEGLNHVAP